MEKLSSIGGDKHEFCHVVICHLLSLSMFAVAKALTSLMHDFIE